MFKISQVFSINLNALLNIDMYVVIKIEFLFIFSYPWAKMQITV